LFECLRENRRTFVRFLELIEPSGAGLRPTSFIAHREADLGQPSLRLDVEEVAQHHDAVSNLDFALAACKCLGVGNSLLWRAHVLQICARIAQLDGWMIFLGDCHAHCLRRGCCFAVLSCATWYGRLA
jgi:hypothetical protein